MEVLQIAAVWRCDRVTSRSQRVTTSHNGSQRVTMGHNESHGHVSEGHPAEVGGMICGACVLPWRRTWRSQEISAFLTSLGRLRARGPQAGKEARMLVAVALVAGALVVMIVCSELV